MTSYGGSTVGVSAVVITWNSAGDISSCINSLLSEGEAVGEIIVVDNASTDGTPGLITGKYPSVRLIRNAQNLGFAAAANQGIREFRGELVLLVNPDVSFEPGFVAGLVDALSEDGSAGAACPKLVRPGGAVIDSAGLTMRKDRKAVDRGQGEPDSAAYDSQCRVFGACGAAALYRRSMLEDIKVDGEYFDESFFSYKEDVDLAWRANLLGWKALYAPKAVAVHARGWKVSGRGGVPRFIRRHSHKNRYLTIIKNDDPSNILRHFPYVLGYEVKLFAYSLIFEPFLFIALWDIIKLLPAALRKRRETMERRKTGPAGMRSLIG